MEDISPVRNLR